MTTKQWIVYVGVPVVLFFGAWGGLRLLDWLLDKLYPGDPGDELPGDKDR
jgi:hypothetical protein